MTLNVVAFEAQEHEDSVSHHRKAQKGEQNVDQPQKESTEQARL